MGTYSLEVAKPAVGEPQTEEVGDEGAEDSNKEEQAKCYDPSSGPHANKINFEDMTYHSTHVPWQTGVLDR